MKTARPKSSTTLRCDQRVMLRLARAEKEMFEISAVAAGMTLSAWMRLHCRQAAAKSLRDEDEPIETRDISHEEAVREILGIFRHRKKQDIYYSDLMEELRLDLQTVIKACKELEDKGLIAGGPGK